MGERIEWHDDKLTASGILFHRQKIFALDYNGHRIGEGRVDLPIANELIVELKAVDVIPPVYRAQVISYLRAFNLRLCLVINFNVPVLNDGVERIVN